MRPAFRRKIATGILASGAALLLLAPAVAAKTKVTLLIHYSTGFAHGKALKAYIDEYNRQNKDVEIEMQFATTDELPTKIAVGAAAGTAPDIVHVSGYLLGELAEQGVLREVPADVQKAMNEQYLPPALAFARHNGKLYGLPTEFMPRAFIYNIGLLEQAGLEPQAPATWSELTTYAKKLTRKDAEGNFEVAGLGLETSSSGQTMFGQFTAFAYSNGAKFLSADNKKTLIDAPEAVQTLEYLTGLINQGVAWAASWSVVPFKQEMIAMTVANGPYYKTEMLQKGQSFYRNIGSGLTPAAKPGKHASGVYGWMFSVTKGSKNADAAYDFLLWLTTKATDKGYTRMGDVLFALGSMPVTKADLAARGRELMNEPFMRGFFTAVANDLTVPDPTVPQANQMMNLFKAELFQAYSGQKPAKQALGDLAKQVQVILDRLYGKK